MLAMSTLISLSQRSSSLRRWYRCPLGRLLADVELSALAEQLPGLFGYHLMVVDPPWETCTLAGVDGYAGCDCSSAYPRTER
jgi:hypothetical protein